MRLLLFLIIISLFSCSGGDSVAGGTTSVGNGFVIASVSYNGAPVSTKVQLVSANHEPGVDSSSNIVTGVSNGEGVVSFEKVPQGEYSLVVIDTINQFGVLEMDITPSAETDINRLRLEPLGSVAYYLPDSLSPEEISLAVKGTPIHSKSSSFVQYENETIQVVFNNIPLGDLLISTIEMNESTVLTVDTLSLIADDTVNVTYGEIVVDNIRPVWEFPLIVGVTSEMITQYGGLQSVRTLVEEHVARSEQAFRQDSFEGYISYPVDSIYEMTGTLYDENSRPPEGFAYRLLYSPHEKSPFGGWDSSTSVMVQDHGVTENGGIWGEESLIGLRWLMGNSRGAYYVLLEEVFAVNNSISQTAYTPDETIMFLRSPDKWIDYNVELINRNGSRLGSTVELTQLKSAETLRLTVVNSAGAVSGGALVEFFGVSAYTHKVSETPLVSQYTNSEGVLEVEAPYLSTDKSLIAHTNMLIRISYQGENFYRWIPYSEVSLSYLQTDSSIFSKHIIL